MMNFQKETLYKETVPGTVYQEKYTSAPSATSKQIITPHCGNILGIYMSLIPNCMNAICVNTKLKDIPISMITNKQNTTE